MAISAPASITVGSVIRGEEVTISWSAVPDAIAYRVQRSVNGASFGDEILNNTTLTFMIDVAGENWNTVQYRVQALKYEGAYLVYSDWTTHQLINVSQPVAVNPPPPVSITVSDYYKNQRVDIEWNAQDFDEDVVYVLQYSYDGGPFITMYTGPNMSTYITPPYNVRTIQYRVRAEVASDRSRYSEWVTSDVKTVQEEPDEPTPAPGVISGRLEQFQNSDGTNIYPRTVMEGVIQRSDGKSLKDLGVFTDGGAEIVFEGSFGSSPHTITITKSEGSGDGTGSGATGPAGPQGEKGEKGDKGDKGDTGEGVPTGGTAGQALVKNSGTNYDTAWKTLFTYGTTDLTAGSSSLASGQIHLVYE